MVDMHNQKDMLEHQPQRRGALNQEWVAMKKEVARRMTPAEKLRRSLELSDFLRKIKQCSKKH